MATLLHVRPSGLKLWTHIKPAAGGSERVAGARRAALPLPTLVLLAASVVPAASRSATSLASTHASSAARSARARSGLAAAARMVAGVSFRKKKPPPGPPPGAGASADAKARAATAARAAQTSVSKPSALPPRLSDSSAAYLLSEDSHLASSAGAASRAAEEAPGPAPAESTRSRR